MQIYTIFPIPQLWWDFYLKLPSPTFAESPSEATYNTVVNVKIKL